MNQVLKEEVLVSSTQSLQSFKPNLFIEIFGYDCFRKFVDSFKIKAKNKSITSFDILLYNVARGHDMKRGFTDVTNKNKLNNGMLKDFAFKMAKHRFKSNLKISKADLFEFGLGYEEKQKLLLESLKD